MTGTLETTPLKFTKAFHAVYRRGRWARGELLSVGVRPSSIAGARVGLRTRRGLKGATVRNRLKRQLRAIIYTGKLPLKGGVDLVVVIHPPTTPVATTALKRELVQLCKHNGALSQSTR